MKSECSSNKCGASEDRLATVRHHRSVVSKNIYEEASFILFKNIFNKNICKSLFKTNFN